jgi:hypothetical protein
MKPIRDMTQAELAAYVQTRLREKGIMVVLSGGTAVAIYSSDQYVSKDVDLVRTSLEARKAIHSVMKSLGFHEENRYFKHPDNPCPIEFPPGPLAVGDEPVKDIREIKYPTGVLRIISPTDCIKDRLAWYYHMNDQQSLEQAILVAQRQDIDLGEIRRWSQDEGKLTEFTRIHSKLIRKHS